MVDSAWWSRGRCSATSAEEVGFVWGKQAERLGGQVGRRVPAGKSGAVSRICFVFKRIVPQRLTHCRSGRVRGRLGDGGGRGGARRARRRRARRARMAPGLSARLPRLTSPPDLSARPLRPTSPPDLSARLPRPTDVPNQCCRVGGGWQTTRDDCCHCFGARPGGVSLFCFRFFPS